MSVDFKGFDEKVVTLLVDDTVEVGSLVMFAENYKVKACTKGKDFIGVCVGIRDGYGAIQIGGYVEATATAILPLGYATIVTGDNNIVEYGSSVVKRLIVYTDETKVGFIL